MNPETLETDFRNAMTTFLNSYFDGLAHTFGTGSEQKTITFPEIDISFDRPQLGEHLEKPHVNIEFQDEISNRGKFTMKGKRQQIIKPARFLVYTADTKRNWEKNYGVMDKLGMLFNAAGFQLAQSGLRVATVGSSVPVNLDASQELQITQRLVTFRIELVTLRAS